MRLILIRHAESRHNIEKIIAVRSACPGLTERGFIQAQTLAQRLQATGEFDGVTQLLCSPALRARQTAEAIAPVLGLPICINDQLTEQDTGVAEGMTHAEYEAIYGAFAPHTEPTRPLAPGGETWEQKNARVAAAMQSIALAHLGQSVVAVSHGGFIVATFLTLLGMTRGFIDPPYTSLTEWEWMEGKKIWRLVRHNA
jgi:probable phosphoglycerate mutase